LAEPSIWQAATGATVGDFGLQPGISVYLQAQA
jgi:hypothetical protein